jgi:YaiO family outer membrane protein
MRILWLAGILMALLFSYMARAEETPTPAPHTAAAAENDQMDASGEVEINGGYSYDGFKNWSGPAVRSSYEPRNSYNEWSAGAARVQEFGATGYLFEGGIDRDLTDTWDTSLDLGGSTSFFLPRFSADVSASKRWFDSEKLTTSFEGGFVRFQDVHRDYSWGVRAAYRFTRPWAVEAGVTADVSLPGSVVTEHQYFGVTQGREKKYLVTLRGEFGRDAFQQISPTASIADYPSYGVSLRLRKWVGNNGWGFVVTGSYDSNPYYQNKGVTVGLFKEFSGGRRHAATSKPRR